ncbi:MAG: phosphatase PAP2 family protein [Thermoplasmatota archaeon]
MKGPPSEKSSIKWNFTLGFFFAVSFSVLTGLVVFGIVDSMDVSIVRFWVSYSKELPLSVTIIFTYTDIPLYLTFLYGFVYFVKEKSYPQGISYLSIVFFSFISYPLLKLIIGRPRPTIFLFHRGSFAYPSGHATMSFAVFIGLYVVYYVYQKDHNYLYFSTLTAAAVITAYSRVFVGFHYLTDIIGGFLLAATIVVLIPTLYQHPLIDKQIESIGDHLEKNIFCRFRR